MKKYISLLVLLLIGFLLITSVVYGWFTYVQRKSIATFNSHELTAEIKINESVVEDSIYLSNLAFIDFEDDLINDKNHAFNQMAQVVKLNVSLHEKAPISRFIFEFDDIDEPLIYIIILDDDIVDYFAFIKSMIDDSSSKEEILLSLQSYNEQCISDLSQSLVLPGESRTLNMVFWADYDQLINQNEYLSYQTQIGFKLSIINAYGDLS